MAGGGTDEAALLRRLQDIVRVNPDMGYRSVHTQVKTEPGFEQVGLKKVQTILAQLKQEPNALASSQGAAAPVSRVSPGENIWTAASDGDLARVEELIEHGGFSPISADENGYTPIHAAASWGRVELLRLMLERSVAADAAVAAANVADSDGDTPLHHVAGAEELEPDVLREVLDVLLKYGADHRRANGEGLTCLDACGEDALRAGRDEEEEQYGEEEVKVNLEFVKAMAERGFELEVPPAAAGEAMEQ